MAATVTGTILNADGTPRYTLVTFEPLTTPLPAGATLITTVIKRAWTSPIDGTFSVTLEEGDYTWKVGGQDDLMISVPNGYAVDSDAFDSGDIAAGGSGYSEDDLITLTGGTALTAAVIKVLAVDGGGAVTDAEVQTAGVYTVQPSNPVAQGSVAPSGGSGATFTLAWLDFDASHNVNDLLTDAPTFNYTAPAPGSEPIATASVSGKVKTNVTEGDPVVPVLSTVATVFNPMGSQYGAVGDGVTDDSWAIQAAIDAAAAAGGGTVFFPESSTPYVTSGNHTVTERIKIIGYGATIKLKDNSTTTVAIFELQADGCSVEGLRFDGNVAGNPTSGTQPQIMVQVESDYCTLKDLYCFDNPQGYTTANGFRSAINVRGDFNLVDHCTVYNPYSYAMVDQGNGNIWRNCKATEYGDGGKGFTFTGATKDYCVVDGFFATSTKADAAEGILIDPQTTDILTRFYGRNIECAGPTVNTGQNLIKFANVTEVYLENVNLPSLVLNTGCLLQDNVKRFHWRVGTCGYRWTCSGADLEVASFENVTFGDGIYATAPIYHIKIENGVALLNVNGCTMNQASSSAILVDKGTPSGTHADYCVVNATGNFVDNVDAADNYVAVTTYDATNSLVYADGYLKTGTWNDHGPNWPRVRIDPDGHVVWKDADGSDWTTEMYSSADGNARINGTLGLNANATSAALVVQGTSGIVDIRDNNTDETEKFARVGVTQYDNSDGLAAMLFGDTKLAQNILSIGGGTSTFDAMTNVRIFTGAAVDTATGVKAAEFDYSTTAGETRMLLYDVDTGSAVRVSVGADDSGGAGYKVLRIPN